jgi:general secretion pathway protein A
MFETQLGLRENPFRAGHHPKYLYPSRGHQEALAHLRHGIRDRESFVLITGEVGTGKTIAVYDALGEWGSRAVVALITDPALTRSELLEEIRLRFGMDAPGPPGTAPVPGQLERLLGAVRARGELAILLLDEAQNLDPELLEEIYRLSNLEADGEKLLQILLVGPPELEVKLAQPELSQLRERIGICHRILPLSATETTHYIHHRVTTAGGNAHELFPTDTCIEVFRLTNGIPREINVVAGQALRHASAEDSQTVTAEHVRAVECEIGSQSVVRDPAVTVAPAAPPPVVPPRELMPFATPRQEAPMAEPFPRLKPAMEPEPLAAEFPPMTPPAPVVRFEPATAPELAARIVMPTPAPASAAGAEVRILPSWFDEIVAERKRIDEQEATAASALAAATSALPGAAPALATEPSAGAPMFVSSAPAMSPEPLPAIDIPAAASAPARIAARESEPLRMPDLSTAPIDFVSRRPRPQSTEEKEQASKNRNGSGWLVPAAVIAGVAISTLVLVRFGPWTLERRRPATAPANSTTPPTAALAAPQARATRPISTPDRSESQQMKIAPSASVPATARATTSAIDAAKPPEAVPVKMTPVSTATAPTTKPAPKRTAAGSATPVPGGSPTPSANKTPAIAPNLFGIAVGSYLDEGRANAERTSLTESTRLPSRIVTVAEDSVSFYRVVMGSFENRVSAERAASDLIRRGLVNEARVIPLARATPPPP